MNHLKICRTVAATISIAAVLCSTVVPGLAFPSGDVPAPVDLVEMDGPGQSHTNDSGISGFDGNQGNDMIVGNAGGRPAETPPEVVDDGSGDELLLPQ